MTNILSNHNNVSKANDQPVILTHRPRATKKDLSFVSDLIERCIKKPSK